MPGPRLGPAVLRPGTGRWRRSPGSVSVTTVPNVERQVGAGPRPGTGAVPGARRPSPARDRLGAVPDDLGDRRHDSSSDAERHLRARAVAALAVDDRTSLPADARAGSRGSDRRQVRVVAHLGGERHPTSLRRPDRRPCRNTCTFMPSPDASSGAGTTSSCGPSATLFAAAARRRRARRARHVDRLAVDLQRTRRAACGTRRSCRRERHRRRGRDRPCRRDPELAAEPVGERSDRAHGRDRAVDLDVDRERAQDLDRQSSLELGAAAAGRTTSSGAELDAFWCCSTSATVAARTVRSTVCRRARS